MGEWAWAAGICPLIGPWRLGAVQAVYQREGGFDPHKQLDFLSRHEVTNVFGTPTAIRSMMSIADAGTRYPQKFRIVCSAGEPLNPEAIRWFREQYGDHRARLLRPDRVLPAVRQLPVHGGPRGLDGPADAGLGCGDPRRGRAPGGRRASAARSALRPRSNPHYPLGYWNRPPEDTEEAFGGDWFHTKDAARADEDGYFWYEGRADDVIISAGYRIGPFEVESACLEHPAVAEAAAVASPDERRGNVVKAFVVLAAGYEPSDELAEEIKVFVRDRHSAYAYPRLIEFVPDLPKTLTGKIRRIELRQHEQERAEKALGRSPPVPRVYVNRLAEARGVFRLPPPGAQLPGWRQFGHHGRPGQGSFVAAGLHSRPPPVRRPGRPGASLGRWPRRSPDPQKSAPATPWSPTL